MKSNKNRLMIDPFFIQKPAFYKDKVEAMMRSAILDLLGHKPGHCQPAFFHMLIVKFPVS
jgi:hypothetical protein